MSHGNISKIIEGKGQGVLSSCQGVPWSQWTGLERTISLVKTALLYWWNFRVHREMAGEKLSIKRQVCRKTGVQRACFLQQGLRWKFSTVKKKFPHKFQGCCLRTWTILLLYLEGTWCGCSVQRVHHNKLWTSSADDHQHLENKDIYSSVKLFLWAMLRDKVTMQGVVVVHYHRAECRTGANCSNREVGSRQFLIGKSSPCQILAS